MTMNRRHLIFGAATLAMGTCSVSESSPLQKERVEGIGGFFFRSHDPKALTAWYQEHLGIDQPSWHQSAGPTAFAPFPNDTKYFGSPQQGWMVNFRVRNLDAMVRQLQASSIEVKVDPKTYPYGRFARLHDPDGNPIELWEPAT